MGYWGRYWLIPTPRDPEHPDWQLGTRAPKGIRVYLDKYHALEDYYHVMEHEDIHDAIDRERKSAPRDKRKHKKFIENRMKEDEAEHIMIKIMMIGRDTTGNEFLDSQECFCPICDLLKSDHNYCMRTACGTQIKRNWHWINDMYDKE